MRFSKSILCDAVWYRTAVSHAFLVISVVQLGSLLQQGNAGKDSTVPKEPQFLTVQSETAEVVHAQQVTQSSYFPPHNSQAYCVRYMSHMYSDLLYSVHISTYRSIWSTCK